MLLAKVRSEQAMSLPLALLAMQAMSLLKALLAMQVIRPKDESRNVHANETD